MATTDAEPKRQNLAEGIVSSASWGDTFAFLKLNSRALICHHFGVSFIVLALYGWINWMPAFFLRIHDWGVAKFSVIYGIVGGVTGIISAVGSGYVTNWLKEKGYQDGAYRTVLFGGMLLTVFTTLAPLMPTPILAIAMFGLGGLFVNFAPAQALTALNEITPNQLRGFVVAIYILVIGIGGAGLGPFAVGWVTDNVFQDEQAVHYSMSLVTFVMGILGAGFLFAGMRAYNQSLERADWE